MLIPMQNYNTSGIKQQTKQNVSFLWVWTPYPIPTDEIIWIRIAITKMIHKRSSALERSSK